MAFTLEDHYNDSDSGGWTNTGQGFSGNITAMVFQAHDNYNLTRISILCYRQGSPGNITLSIQSVTGSPAVPDGSVLASVVKDPSGITTSTSGEWVDFDLASPYSLSSGTQYAIAWSIAGTDTSNRMWWRLDGSSPAYANGHYCYSSNGGSSWTALTSYDCAFETYSGSASSYVDMSGSSSITFTASGTMTELTLVDMAGSSSITFTASGSLSRSTIRNITEATKYIITACDNRIYIGS